MESAKRMMESKKNDHEIHPLVAEFVSDRSLKVLKEFGMEAPDILNDYSCELEDLLIAMKERITSLEDEVREYKCRLDIPLTPRERLLNTLNGEANS